MSVFDKDTFLNQEVKGANEAKYTPLPIGEYKGYVDELDMDSYEDNPILVVTYALMDDDGKLKAALGLEKPTVQDRIFLDVEKDGGLSFGPNKNVRLGRLREAVKQNEPKKAWNFNMLRGQGPVLLKVSHRYNKTTGEGPFSQIDRVAAAA